MSRQRHRLASADDFWKRIVARYGCRTVLSRPRVPLVFLQRRVARPARLSSGKAPSYVASYHLALHVHLAWPAWLGSARARHSHEAAPRQSRHLAMARLAFAGAPRLGNGSASPGSNAVASASMPARSHEAPPQPSPDVATFTDVSPSAALRNQAFGSVAPRGAAGVLGLLGRRSRVSAGRVERASLRTALRRRAPLARFGGPASARGKHQASPFDQRAVMTPRALTRRGRRPDDEGPSWMQGARSQLYGDAVPRSLASQPIAQIADAVVAREHRPDVPASRPRESAPQSPIDLGKLSEEVYRHIQRKIRIERERRGL